MAINYPVSLDTFPNPTSTDLLENATAALDHDVQHSNANDAIEALEAKVGITSSAVTTSHDYKLSAVTGSAKALTSGTSTQSVTGLTLVSPVLTLTSDATGDMYYRNSGGALTRLAIGSSGQIIQVSSGGIPEWIANPAATDASTTVKGVVEEATQAEVDAGTAAGGTSARLFVNPSTVRAKLYHDYAASSTGNDTYVITVTPAPTAYTTGDVYVFEPDTANTGTCTINVNSLGAKNILRSDGSALLDADIAAGGIYVLVYDGTNMVLQNPSKTKPIYTETTASDTLQISSDSEKTGSATSYTLLKEIEVYYKGTIRAKYDYKKSGSTDNSTTRLYVNGSAVGTERTNTTVYQTSSDDVTVDIGDLIQVYGDKVTNSAPSETYNIQNFRLYFDVTTTTSYGVVNTA